MELTFGALVPKLKEQLDDQNLVDPMVSQHQKIADAITLLAVAEILTDAEKHKARGRLVKRMSKIVGNK